MHDSPKHCAAFADDLGECSCVDALYAWNVLFVHPLRQGLGTTPVARRVAVLRDDECRGPYLARLKKTERERMFEVTLRVQLMAKKFNSK